jgi:hypothetical protein
VERSRQSFKTQRCADNADCAFSSLRCERQHERDYLSSRALLSKKLLTAMTEKRIFKLVHSTARQGAARYIATEAPDGYRVTVEPEKRSLDQNAALHARIGEIAKVRTWDGRKWDTETWKRLFCAAWCRATAQESVTILPALDGAGVDLIPRRTSDLSQRECSDLIEFINAWDAEQEAA